MKKFTLTTILFSLLAVLLTAPVYADEPWWEWVFLPEDNAHCVIKGQSIYCPKGRGPIVTDRKVKNQKLIKELERSRKVAGK